jgi:hypothetical protein
MRPGSGKTQENNREERVSVVKEAKALTEPYKSRSKNISEWTL